MRLPYLVVPVVAGALLAAASISGAAPPQQEPAEPQPAPAHAATAAAYVGAETCAACHDSEATHLAGTPHGKAAFGRLSDLGCETCHGPGAAHAENPDDPALHPRVDRLSVAAQSAVCRTCHDGGQQMFWQGSRHQMRGLSCISCHSVHAPKTEQAQLKTATVSEQCFACHKDVRAETWKNSHHPIREGKISCSDCHNPHGASTPKLIRAVSVNDQCYSCHAEKRGPFLWDHPPVRESCLTCHTPHGSNHLKLQKTSVPYLCQQCHANTRHPGTLYDGLRVPTLEDPARGSNRVFNRACLDCHAAIHGSNHPSAPYLAH
ncbi:MAG TPA: DmsE family decaheme c-type cytochrome [Thermoanaerobaculia bacterium]|nr:DmsE family decaheme c-type cytochrome [Thermoanaerobaculia bacterium]